jgi:hypothetical protein
MPAVACGWRWEAAQDNDEWLVNNLDNEVAGDGGGHKVACFVLPFGPNVPRGRKRRTNGTDEAEAATAACGSRGNIRIFILASALRKNEEVARCARNIIR